MISEDDLVVPFLGYLLTSTALLHLVLVLSSFSIYNSLRQIKLGAIRLAETTHGPSSLAQAALPTILDPKTPGLKEWKANLRRTLQNQADSLCSKLHQCPGLRVMPAQGAFFTTIKVDTKKLAFENDVEFCMRLVDEENVFVVPGSSMGVQQDCSLFRVAFCASEQVLGHACDRIQRFCWRHIQPARSTAR